MRAALLLITLIGVTNNIYASSHDDNGIILYPGQVLDTSSEGRNVICLDMDSKIELESNKVVNGDDKGPAWKILDKNNKLISYSHGLKNAQIKAYALDNPLKSSIFQGDGKVLLPGETLQYSSYKAQGGKILCLKNINDLNMGECSVERNTEKYTHIKWIMKNQSGSIQELSHDKTYAMIYAHELNNAGLCSQ